MKVNPITIIITVAFFYPLIRGFILAFSSNNMKNDIYDIEGDISFVISLIISMYYCKKIFIMHESGIYKYIYDLFPSKVLILFEDKPSLIYIVMLPLMVFVFYKTLKLLFKIIDSILLYPILDIIENTLKKRSIFSRRIVGTLFEIPKSISYVLFITFILNIISMFNLSQQLNTFMENSKTYNYLCKSVVIPITNSKLARQLPDIINNSFKVEIRQNLTDSSNNKLLKPKTIVYYNGVTLEEGIRSNEEIDNFSRSLIGNDNLDKSKAKSIYSWIGTNVSYDYNKANSVLNNDFNIISGAIPTFEGKKGICFDYACLYVAMCRATNIQVRMVTGEGFNGVSWVSHAWNQVYVSEEGKWINVDTTFSKGGNYFNSKRFELDHKDAKIVGEW